jgi:hypothetical protein
MDTPIRYKFAVIAVCTSIAVAFGLAMYEGYIPIKVAQTSIKQAAGQLPGTGISSPEGGPLHQHLNGADTP